MGSFKGFTLDWYRDLFKDTRLFLIVLNTFAIAILSSLVATIVGIFGALAFILINRGKRGIPSFH